MINTFTQRNDINGLELPFFYNKNTDAFVGVFWVGGGIFCIMLVVSFFFPNLKFVLKCKVKLDFKSKELEIFIIKLNLAKSNQSTGLCMIHFNIHYKVF